MEQGKNYEALLTLPFSEVALSKEEALQKLSQRFKTVAEKNFDDFIAIIKPETPNYENAVDYYERMKEGIKILPAGGFGMVESDIDIIYGKWGNLTYEQVMEKIVMTMKSQLDHEGTPDNPVVASAKLGLVFDTINMLSPDVASYDDGVKVFASVLRKNSYPINPFLLGAMVDDVIKRVSTAKDPVPFSFFADSEQAAIFGASYHNHANFAEKVDFQNGLSITINELQYLISGTSAN